MTEIGSSQWRRDMRADLIARRQEIPVAQRNKADAKLAHMLGEYIGDVAGKVVSIYWPFRGEPDLRTFAKACRQQGAVIALPVVVEKAAPLAFREWADGMSLDRGVWNIPIPPADAPKVMPDIVIAPVVGADADNYRLGYGGGFFDRTLEHLRQSKAAKAIGVGYAEQRMETIYPHKYDIPMDHMILVDT
ncbi:5,10-methenyltetrahydrofolate synthetase [Roseovarius nanhaiticus]|uniref:5-formyltetrahydrofolate cyclo-ligase n=1 Tax=Roseovarius nanhaiticus TaxID=573024 RepID=A0A1N7FHG1_9RHOB|nr:5-formyltetrahydrofolate cyclo-ligase [Roseovarius nanhaiticus]SEK54222.1 5,10-methenyltetrahydrofolate synthetase [Roseovarius nanhaiticus]SIR99868.1 5,10-methenyltetrahydrofolate synthetase [Roseovarius nanhaiticus]